jgi:hypothetical protein
MPGALNNAPRPVSPGYYHSNVTSSAPPGTTLMPPPSSAGLFGAHQSHGDHLNARGQRRVQTPSPAKTIAAAKSLLASNSADSAATLLLEEGYIRRSQPAIQAAYLELIPPRC